MRLVFDSLVSIYISVLLKDSGYELGGGTHGNRNTNANPIANFRLTDMNSPFRRATASANKRSSVITLTAAMNCHRLNCKNQISSATAPVYSAGSASWYCTQSSPDFDIALLVSSTVC